MLSISTLYRESVIILLVIMYIIIALILYIVENFNSKENKFPTYFSMKMESFLDVTFVLFPTIIVLYLIVPSVGYIYNTEFALSELESFLNLTVIGHQWYWSYEYNISMCNNYSFPFLDINIIHDKLEFDSLMEINPKTGRLLEVDKRVVLPVALYIKASITSQDVIHSWAIPQLGIKTDAIPGRIAEIIFNSVSTGVFYGQCSELCGVNHGFMPIVLEFVSYSDYLDFISISLNINPSGLLISSLYSF